MKSISERGKLENSIPHKHVRKMGICMGIALACTMFGEGLDASWWWLKPVSKFFWTAGVFFILLDGIWRRKQLAEKTQHPKPKA